jgi:hypothetical protein
MMRAAPALPSVTQPGFDTSRQPQTIPDKKSERNTRFHLRFAALSAYVYDDDGRPQTLG